MDRVIKDGQVAVIVSPGFGAGFHTWNDIPNLCFCPYVVNHILNDTTHLVEESELLKIYGFPKGDYICTLGLSKAVIEWIPQGTHFTIDEYDGSETIQYIDSIAIIA